MQQTTVERIRVLQNNDPLAHVYLLLDYYDGELAKERMFTEFVTDMGERLVDQPFRSTYGYTHDAEEIQYDTGLRYIASLRQSYEAALQDVAKGSFTSYHADRQKAFLEQGNKLLEWLHTDDSSQHILLVSLCPPENELPATEAKKQSFKPNRMMASVQLHSKNNDGTATTTAFSLDGLSIERLQKLLQTIGLDEVDASSTLELVEKPIYIHSEDAAESVVSTIITSYDTLLFHESYQTYKQGISTEKTIVEANAYVASHPEVFMLYKAVVEHVTDSLVSNVVSGELAKILNDNLVRQYRLGEQVPSYLTIKKGDVFTPYIASQLIEYLRKRAIPEYLTQRLLHNDSVTSIASGGIGSAGASATQSGRVYDGACPSSITSLTNDATAEQAAQLGLNAYVTSESPKPLFIVGNYAVIPIGSCPASCKTECGIGIKDMQSGNWYCANSRKCSGYSSKVYDIVFNPDELQESTIDTKKVEVSENVYTTSNDDISFELKFVQKNIWEFRELLFDENISYAERQEIITMLIAADLRKQHLLRVAIGSEAYIQADQVWAA